MGDHDSLVLTLAQVGKHFVHLVNQRCVACEVLDLLVRDDKSADGLGKVDQKRRVSHVIFSDLSLIVSKLGKVLLAPGSENGQAHHSVAYHDGAVLDKHRVIDTHQESLLQDKADMSVQFVETIVDVALLPVLAIVEGDFLRVSEQVAMERPVLALKACFLGGKAAEWRGNHSNDETRESVPTESDSGTFPAHKLGKFPREQDHIKGRLHDVDVQSREAASPLFAILRQPLIRVGDAIVQVADLVVMHVAQVLFVEVGRQSLAEQKRQLLLDVVNARVDH